MSKIKLTSGRDHNLNDVWCCKSGEVVAADQHGLYLFDAELNFVKSLVEEHLVVVRGVTEDNHGRIITINHNDGSKKSSSMVTQTGNTSIIVIDKEKNKVFRNFDLGDLILAAKADLNVSDDVESSCQNVCFKNGNLYVTGIK